MRRAGSRAIAERALRRNSRWRAGCPTCRNLWCGAGFPTCRSLWCRAGFPTCPPGGRLERLPHTLRRRALVGENLRDACRQRARIRDVQELVRSVRIAVRAEDSGDEELRLGVARAEHPHERNRSPFAERHRPFAEVRFRCALDRLLEPRRDLRRDPAAAAFFGIEENTRAVRRVAFEQVLQLAVDVAGVERR